MRNAESILQHSVKCALIVNNVWCKHSKTNNSLAFYRNSFSPNKLTKLPSKVNVVNLVSLMDS